MTTEEWKASASKEAVEQYEKPVVWFREHVKCCGNCPYRLRDPDLMGDYAWNNCRLHPKKNGKSVMMKWDCFCDDYSGTAEEDNLIDFAKLNWEEPHE